MTNYDRTDPLSQLDARQRVSSMDIMNWRDDFVQSSSRLESALASPNFSVDVF